MDKKIVIPANLCRSRVDVEANTIELSMTQETFDKYFAEQAKRPQITFIGQHMDPAYRDKLYSHESRWKKLKGLDALDLGTHIHQEIGQHMDRAHRAEMEKRFNQEVLGDWASCPRDRALDIGTEIHEQLGKQRQLQKEQDFNAFRARMMAEDFTLEGTETDRLACTHTGAEHKTFTAKDLKKVHQLLKERAVPSRASLTLTRELQKHLTSDPGTLFYGGRGGGKNELIKRTTERAIVDLDFAKLEEYCMADVQRNHTHMADAFMQAMLKAGYGGTPEPEPEQAKPIEETFPDGTDDPMDMVRAFCK